MVDRKPVFLEKVKVKQFCYNCKRGITVKGQYHAFGRELVKEKNPNPDAVFHVIATTNLPQGHSEWDSPEVGYVFIQHGSVQVFIVANSMGRRFKATQDDLMSVEDVKYLKVFKVNDYDWVCARSPEEALEWYEKETGVDDGNYRLDEVEECDLDTDTMYVDENRETKSTFREMIDKNAIEGMTAPYIICSTEF